VKTFLLSDLRQQIENLPRAITISINHQQFLIFRWKKKEKKEA